MDILEMKSLNEHLKRVLSLSFNIPLEEISEDKTLNEIGIKKSDLILINHILEQEFDIRISTIEQFEQIQNSRRISDLIEFIEKNQY